MLLIDSSRVAIGEHNRGYGSYGDEYGVSSMQNQAVCPPIKHVFRAIAVSEPLRFNPSERESSLTMQIHDHRSRDRDSPHFLGSDRRRIMTDPVNFNSV
jgi:hypothetical protein